MFALLQRIIIPNPKDGRCIEPNRPQPLCEVFLPKGRDKRHDINEGTIAAGQVGTLLSVAARRPARDRRR
jgi:hypothetical protein